MHKKLYENCLNFVIFKHNFRNLFINKYLSFFYKFYKPCRVNYFFIWFSLSQNLVSYLNGRTTSNLKLDRLEINSSIQGATGFSQQWIKTRPICWTEAIVKTPKDIKLKSCAERDPRNYEVIEVSPHLLVSRERVVFSFWNSELRLEASSSV